jgi:hypothetical protein
MSDVKMGIETGFKPSKPSAEHLERLTVGTPCVVIDCEGIAHLATVIAPGAGQDEEGRWRCWVNLGTQERPHSLAPDVCRVGTFLRF